jgi:hypothetical protein
MNERRATHSDRSIDRSCCEWQGTIDCRQESVFYRPIIIMIIMMMNGPKTPLPASPAGGAFGVT